jgi:hypothetical protein
LGQAPFIRRGHFSHAMPQTPIFMAAFYTEEGKLNIEHTIEPRRAPAR